MLPINESLSASYLTTIDRLTYLERVPPVPNKLIGFDQIDWLYHDALCLFLQLDLSDLLINFSYLFLHLLTALKA